VYSNLLHFIANSPKPEKDRIMTADEIIKRINYICPLDFHVTPSDILNGDVHANIEMLSKLCSRLTVVSQNRSINILRQSLIPTKRATMKARLAGSPSNSGLGIGALGGSSGIGGNANLGNNSGRPPASPFSRKAPTLSGLAGKGVSHVRVPRTGSGDADNSSMHSFDTHDTMKRPLGRWPECLQNNESKSPHTRRLAPPRELSKTKSFLEKTKSQQDLLLGALGDAGVTGQSRLFQSTATVPGVTSARSVTTTGSNTTGELTSVRSMSPNRITVATPVGAAATPSSVTATATASPAAPPLPPSSTPPQTKPQAPSSQSRGVTKSRSFVGTSSAPAPHSPAVGTANSTDPGLATPEQPGTKKLTTVQSTNALTRKPSFLSPTQSSSAYVATPDPKIKQSKELHRSKSWVSSVVITPTPAQTSEPSSSTKPGSGKPPVAAHSPQKTVKSGISTSTESSANTPSTAPRGESPVVGNNNGNADSANGNGASEPKLLKKTSSFMKATATSAARLN
jgi:hypothetical protein